MLTEKSNKTYAYLTTIFDLIFKFKALHKKIIEEIELMNTERKFQENERRMQMAVGEDDDQQSFSRDLNSQVGAGIKRANLDLLHSIARDYRSAFNEFQKQLENNEKLKFINFRLDFNEFYSLARQQISDQKKPLETNDDLQKFGRIYSANLNSNQTNYEISYQPKPAGGSNSDQLSQNKFGSRSFQPFQ